MLAEKSIDEAVIDVCEKGTKLKLAPCLLLQPCYFKILYPYYFKKGIYSFTLVIMQISSIQRDMPLYCTSITKYTYVSFDEVAIFF